MRLWKYRRTFWMLKLCRQSFFVSLIWTPLSVVLARALQGFSKNRVRTERLTELGRFAAGDAGRGPVNINPTYRRSEDGKAESQGGRHLLVTMFCRLAS